MLKMPYESSHINLFSIVGSMVFNAGGVYQTNQTLWGPYK